MVGGMDRQTLQDWVMRFNQQGPAGLINESAQGAPGKLSEKHKAFLARLVEEGSIPAIHGVDGGGPLEACAWHTHRGVVPGGDAGWAEEQADLSLGQEGLTPPRHSRSTD
jgi:hypothetical protein